MLVHTALVFHSFSGFATAAACARAGPMQKSPENDENFDHRTIAQRSSSTNMHTQHARARARIWLQTKIGLTNDTRQQRTVTRNSDTNLKLLCSEALKLCKHVHWLLIETSLHTNNNQHSQHAYRDLLAHQHPSAIHARFHECGQHAIQYSFQK